MGVTQEKTYRVLLSTAATYTAFLEETNGERLAFWGSVYGKGDIQAWARGQIEEILKRANGICLDSDQLTSALSAVPQHVDRLVRAGWELPGPETQTRCPNGAPGPGATW